MRKNFAPWDSLCQDTLILLIGNGTISHNQAMEKAENEYKKYKQKTLSSVEKKLKKNIANYTSLDTLRFMLPERAGEDAGRLSVMHVAYMNDPSSEQKFLF